MFYAKRDNQMPFLIWTSIATIKLAYFCLKRINQVIDILFTILYTLQLIVLSRLGRLGRTKCIKIISKIS